MFPSPEDELAQFSKLLAAASEIALNYLNSLADRPVAWTDSTLGLSPNLADSLAETGCGTAQTLEKFQQEILPYLSASPGSRYWGFVTGGTTPAALVGDWLGSATDQNLMVPGDSIATAVELTVLDLLKDLFSLSREGFVGTFTTGATASNLVSLATARQWGGLKLGQNIAQDGLTSLDQFAIFATTPHASQLKIQGILGFGQRHWIKVRGLPDANGREGEAMDVQDLKLKLEATAAPVKIVVSSAGTVTTTAFDDFCTIAQLCQYHQAWHHLDGAFGLFARCSSHYRHLTAGVELADSITVDCHKWLNVPYDCGVVFTQHQELLEETFSVGAAYLKTGDQWPSLMNRGIENSQRFRGLPIWFALTAYGSHGVQKTVESCCQCAHELAEWIEASAGYQLLLSPTFNVVLLAGKFEGDLVAVNVQNQRLLQAINQSGKVFLSPGNYQGQFCFRAAFSNWRTTAKDVEIAIEALEQAYNTLIIQLRKL
ncbi:MAG: pyridoxal phosphate-dependent decarboxylase family protein [Microcoleaceae cyanobacterium]